MIWQRDPSSAIMHGFSVRVHDPDYVKGPVTLYAVGEENVLQVAKEYNDTTTDRVSRQCVAVLLLWRDNRLVECQHLYFNITGDNHVQSANNNP